MLVERGMEPKHVAARTGGSLAQITGLLASAPGRALLEELRAEREFQIMEQRDLIRSARPEALKTLIEARGDKDASWTTRIKAATELLDRDVDGVFTKTSRSEVSGRIELGYNREGWLDHTQNVLNDVGAAPGDVINASYGDVPVTSELDDEDAEQDEARPVEPVEPVPHAPTVATSFHLNASAPVTAERIIPKKMTKAERSAMNKAAWAAQQEAKKAARRAARANAEGDG